MMPLGAGLAKAEEGSRGALKADACGAKAEG